MRNLDPVWPEAMDDLPLRVTETARLFCTPSQLFSSFERAMDWKAWMGVEVEWGDGKVEDGAVRVVRMGPFVMEEVVTVWRPGAELSMYVARSNNPLLVQFAERWTVQGTSTGCVAVWEAALRPASVGHVLARRLLWSLATAAHSGFTELERLALGDEAEARFTTEELEP
ncbi:MAG: SRPBCC family protein [Myxococcales bacterium]|nr:SRPBCC family protein [Myxococcales bacterium]